MFVKQIDMAKALELAAKGMEIKVLAPIGQEGGWENLVPDTLQNMLGGVMFFRQEPGPGEGDPSGGFRRCAGATSGKDSVGPHEGTEAGQTGGKGKAGCGHPGDRRGSI